MMVGEGAGVLILETLDETRPWLAHGCAWLAGRRREDGEQPMSVLKEFIIPTLGFYPNRNPKLHMFALWYFTILIVTWITLGVTVLGFEQSYAHPITGVATAIAVQMILEWVNARATKRRLRFAGGLANFLNFLPPAIIPGVACAMLIFPNERLWPVAFAAGLSVASKVIFRAPIGNGQTQHIFNPSNIGITATFLLMPSVGAAPHYQFTQDVSGLMRWIIPGIVLIAGIIVHAKFTGRLPLVAAWLFGFVAQALIRVTAFGMPLVVPFIPMTSAAFTVFTLFMIPDPATTPIKPWRQVAFGLAVAGIYGLLFVFHIVFGLFIALATVSALRGISLYVTNLGEWAPRGNTLQTRAASASAGD
jgi:Na+-translocating ferredoxin:NAD+ oxidoreductase RnfD subunit